MRTMSTPPTKVMNLSLCFKGFCEWSDEFSFEVGSPYHQTCNRIMEIVDWLSMRVFGGLGIFDWKKALKSVTVL